MWLLPFIAGVPPTRANVPPKQVPSRHFFAVDDAASWA